MVEKDRLTQLLLHEKPNVRIDAGRALQKFFPGSSHTIHQILKTVDMHGLKPNLSLTSLIRFFNPDTTETGELTRLYTESLRIYDTHYERLLMQLEKAFLLFPFFALQESATGFRFNRELRRIYERARGLDTLKRRNASFLWKRLIDFCDENRGSGLFGDDLIYGKVLIAGLARYPEEITHHLLMNLSRKSSWNYHLEEYLIQLAGEMKLEAAIDHLFSRLEENGIRHTMYDRIVRSLSSIGTDRVIKEVVKRYESEKDHAHLFPEILGGINHPESERALIEMFRQETDPGILSFIATGLTSLYSKEGADLIRDTMGKKPGFKSIMKELDHSLYSVDLYHTGGKIKG